MKFKFYSVYREKTGKSYLFLIPSSPFSFFFQCPSKFQWLRTSAHNPPFIRVPNIFPPYRCPPSNAQDLALALTWALDREVAPTLAHARAGKGRFHSRNFCEFLEFLQDFLATNSLRSHSVRTVRTHNTNSTPLCDALCIFLSTFFMPPLVLLQILIPPTFMPHLKILRHLF